MTPMGLLLPVLQCNVVGGAGKHVTCSMPHVSHDIKYLCTLLIITDFYVHYVLDSTDTDNPPSPLRKKNHNSLCTDVDTLYLMLHTGNQELIVVDDCP